jgi:hypothetical protein
MTTIREYQEQTGHSVSSTENQRILDKFVQREVIYCVSALVYELAQKFECFPDYEDDLLDAFKGVPDYEEAARQEGWDLSPLGEFYKEDENQLYLSVNLQERGQVHVSCHQQEYPGQGTNGQEIWSFVGTEDEADNLDGSENFNITDPAEVEEFLFEQDVIDAKDELSDDDGCNFETSNEDLWEGLCQEQGIDAEEYRSDIFEHWIVSDYLARRLEDKGHRVLRDFFGMTVWCRPTTGQAILLDSVIAEIALDMGILVGQDNEWRL